MDADPSKVNNAIRKRWGMRVGRKLGRTVYLVDPEANDPMVDLCVGIMDTRALAEEVVRKWNQAR